MGPSPFASVIGRRKASPSTFDRCTQPLFLVENILAEGMTSAARPRGHPQAS